MYIIHYVNILAAIMTGTAVLFLAWIIQNRRMNCCKDGALPNEGFLSHFTCLHACHCLKSKPYSMYHAPFLDYINDTKWIKPILLFPGWTQLTQTLLDRTQPNEISVLCFVSVHPWFFSKYEFKFSAYYIYMYMHIQCQHNCC